MKTFTIHNLTSGADLGTYEAETKSGALEALARDAGYKSHADACETTGESGADFLVTEEQTTDATCWA